MDHESLRTAGTYLNNLLLARGLLRNGEPIDFVKPSKDSRAHIINLVHDLILRQDRDREQRENVALTLQTMRGEEVRKNQELERLRQKCDDSLRQCSSAVAAERAAVAEVKKVERAIKTLQEQTAKLKTQFAQVKTQCTNDLRKRDLELNRLKTHLQGQQRGIKSGTTAPSITIFGVTTGTARSSATDALMRSVNDPEYSLKQETTEFLTELSQSLSDENDKLISLIRRSVNTIQELLGISSNGQRTDSAIGSLSSADGGKDARGSMLHAPPTSCEAFSNDLDQALGHLKGILTNPNFVTMDEVEVRDEEIARLREGWDRMEQRWKDVLVMMQGWLRRMNTGESINIEDLRCGMGLVSPGRGMPQPLPRPVSSGKDIDSSLVSGAEEVLEPSNLPTFDDDSSILREESPILARRPSPKRKRDVLEPPESFDLRPKSAVASQSQAKTNASVAISDDIDSENDEQSQDERSAPGWPGMTVAEKLAFAQTEADDAVKADEASKEVKGHVSLRSSRIPTARHHAQSQQAPAPISKLDGAGDELAANQNLEEGSENEGKDTLGSMRRPDYSPMGKRVNIRGRPRKKRKSTLSPEELEMLIGSLREE